MAWTRVVENKIEIVDFNPVEPKAYFHREDIMEVFTQIRNSDPTKKIMGLQMVTVRVYETDKDAPTGKSVGNEMWETHALVPTRPGVEFRADGLDKEDLFFDAGAKIALSCPRHIDQEGGVEIDLETDPLNKEGKGL